MKFRPPIYILPLLVVGALLLDRLEGAVGTLADEDPSARNDLASVLGTAPAPEASPGIDMTVLEHQLPGSHAVILRAEPANAANLSGLADPSGLATRADAIKLHDDDAAAITIEFELGRPGFARMDIYDARGRAVRKLIGEVFNAGALQRTWDGCNDEGVRLPSGAYFARLESLGQVSSLQVVLD